MGIESTHGSVCFLFERQIWFVNYCKGSWVLLVLRRYIVSWREYFGCPEVFFFLKHGDEKFDISFVICCKPLVSVLYVKFFFFLLTNVLLNIFLWFKNIVILNYNECKLLKFIKKKKKKKPLKECSKARIYIYIYISSFW